MNATYITAILTNIFAYIVSYCVCLTLVILMINRPFFDMMLVAGAMLSLMIALVDSCVYLLRNIEYVIYLVLLTGCIALLTNLLSVSMTDCFVIGGYLSCLVVVPSILLRLFTRFKMDHVND